jgi:UDP-N-acetylmuramoylalanine--D-glutamate ligase
MDAKLNIVRFQGPGDVAVVGANDTELQSRVLAMADAHGGRFVSAAHEGERYELRVPGPHNQANAHMAVMMARAFGVPGDIACHTVSGYAGLPHRLEWVGEVRGVGYYNDSKSTSAEAVATALKAIDRPVVLLCGGKDTGAELDRVVESPWENVRAVITFGDASERLGNLIESQVGKVRGIKVIRAPKMVEAIHHAREIAQSGDVVLLSPGCPSYDEFVNYEQRGRVFAEMVRERK